MHGTGHGNGDDGPIRDLVTHASTGGHVEKRRERRRRVYKGAVLAFNGHHMAIPCVVRDISETGARVKLDGHIGIPRHLELMIDNDGFVVDCAVIWRTERETGLSFVSKPHLEKPLRPQSISKLVR